MSQLLNNICFNERQSVWTTRYDWNPTVSENINGTFFSIGGSNMNDDSVETNNDIWSHEVTNNKPTYWFNKQHPFEFEFVVNDPQGVHKIIENLQILSNNVQPEQLTFEIIGDAYQFNKQRIMHLARGEEDFTGSRVESNLLNKDKFDIPKKTTDKAEKFDMSSWIKNKSKIKVCEYNEDGSWKGVTKEVTPSMEQDERTKQYLMSIPQECRNMETFGRRLGNIHYKEDSWYTNVEPIIYDARLNDPNSSLKEEGTKFNSTRIRDKWVKIRVRYTGEDLAIITAIRTIMNV